jgi:hypothetical protein
MPIKGIRTIDKINYSIFYVDSFSVALKKIIRKQLQGIYNGFALIDSVPEFYSYKNTLKSFLDRYNDKTDKIKKGMIGELLAHILLNQQKNNLTSLSILKNKEERSIKKGFDIIYFNTIKNQLWYSEVKAGKSTKYKSTPYNETLLNRAKKGISVMIDEKRNSLWESALIDVELVIKEKKKQIKFK